MNLAIHYHIPFQKINEVYYTDGQQGVFIDALSPFFNNITCFLHEPLEHEKPLMDYAFKSENIEIVSLGPHYSLPKRLLRFNYYLSIFKSNKSKFDALFIRTPTPLSNFLISEFRDICLIYVVGDYIDGLPTMKGSFPKKFMISLWAYTYEYLQNKNSKSILTITNGALKLKRLQKYNADTILIPSTTLNHSDFFIRQDTCLQETIKVLYTGRIDEAKGLEDILNAILNLASKGLSIEFHLAGIILEKNSTLINRLKEVAEKRGYFGMIHWYGKLKIGDELNALYRKCDIYCIASRSGFEGFPRTLWESMANSLPIVATKVGSIPLILNNKVTALLVEPNDISSIELAICQIVSNKSLRVKLIENGRKLASSNTLEAFGKKMSNVIIEHFGNKVMN